MSDFTPSLDQIRGRYCDGTTVQTGRLTGGEEFDRAIAKVRAEAKAEALREAADDLDSESPFHHYADTEAHWQIGGKWADRLRARADNLEAS